MTHLVQCSPFAIPVSYTHLEEQEREFIDDLYFLKKHGNNSAHSVKVHKDGIEALECLQRAFEVAINYCVYAVSYTHLDVYKRQFLHSARL